MEVTGKRADSVSEPCKACQIDGKCIQADGYCQDCDENMCQKCFQHHVKGKLCRNHVMSPLGLSMLHGQDKSECNEKCRTHTTENIKYYCREHDMITCGDCNVAYHHGCKIEFICNIADQYENSSEFGAILKKIEQLEIKNNESRTKIDNHRKANKMLLDKALSEIKNFRKELNDYLDRMEKDIVSEANNTSKENDELMSELEMMTSVAQQDIDDIMNNLDSNIIQGDKLFIRTKEYKLKLCEVVKNVSYIIKNNTLKRFAFKQEQMLAQMVRSGTKLGCLRIQITCSKEATTAEIQKNQQQTEPLTTALTMKADIDVDEKIKSLPTGGQNFQKTYVNRKCEWNNWTASPVESLRSNQVRCLPATTNYYSQYFEDQRRTDGGDVRLMLPSTWAGMKITDKTRVVLLSQTDPEYINVYRKLGYTVGQFVSIERIQNPTLYTQYIGKKRQMEMTNAGGRPVEQQLWYGTRTKQAVDSIIQRGFGRNYNSGFAQCVEGYFTPALQTSLGYCSQDPYTGQRYIILADVLTGEYCSVSGAFRVPPMRTGSLTYDSTTDNVYSPSNFEIYHDAQAYPTYVITFR